MPKINWDDVPDSTGILPDGTYPVMVADVEESESRFGDPMWKLTLKVVGGEHEGALIFDRVTFNQKGLSRVKLVCKALGMDTTGEKSLTPNMLVGRAAMVDVYAQEYEKADGTRSKSNNVPFGGYRPMTENPKAKNPDDDIPF